MEPDEGPIDSELFEQEKWEADRALREREVVVQEGELDLKRQDLSDAELFGSSSFLVQAEAQKGEKAFYFSEIETMLTSFVRARLGAF
jgi:hypothetical protein